MNIEVDRNAYGSQTESFEEKIHVRLGADKTTPRILDAIFIRAPKIKKQGSLVKSLQSGLMAK